MWTYLLGKLRPEVSRNEMAYLVFKTLVLKQGSSDVRNVLIRDAIAIARPDLCLRYRNEQFSWVPTSRDPYLQTLYKIFNVRESALKFRVLPNLATLSPREACSFHCTAAEASVLTRRTRVLFVAFCFASTALFAA